MTSTALVLTVASALPAFALVPSVGDQSVNGVNRTTTTGNPAVPSGGTGGTNYCQNVITPFGGEANNASPTGFSGGGVTWTIGKNDGVAATGSGQSDYAYNKNGVTPSGVQGGVTNFYQLAMDPTAISNTANPSATAGQYEDLTLTANQPVASLSFTLLDVDIRDRSDSGNYRDVAGVIGFNGSTPVSPVTSRIGSALRPGTPSTPGEVVYEGTDNVAATSQAANFTVTFPTPVTSVRVRYSSGALPIQPGGAGYPDGGDGSGNAPTKQLIGISPFQYCGNSIGTAKAADTPVRAGNAYTVNYTYTVENTGGTNLYYPQLYDNDATDSTNSGLINLFGTRVSGTPTAPGTWSYGTPSFVQNGTVPVGFNPAFNGTNDLFNHAGTLQPGEAVKLRLPVTFVPSVAQQTALDNGSATWNNYAASYANSDPANTTFVSDTNDRFSVNGPTSDANGNGRANDDQGPTPITITRQPAVSLTKAYAGTYTDADGNGQVSVGDTLNYTFTVTNTGNTELGATTINDAKIPAAGITCPTTPVIPVGGTRTCTGRYVVTAADAAATQTTNNATVTTTPVGTGATPITSTRTPDVVVPVPEVASIDLQKAFASGAGPFTVGQAVNYTFTLTNTGRVPLTAVSVTDAKLGLTNDLCGSATLAPQATTTCTRPYTITQADVNAGQLVNAASTVGTSPSGRTVNDTADARVVVQQSPAVALTKAQTGNDDADGSGAVSAGDTLTYTFTARNTGNVTLNPVTVADPKLGVTGLACGGPLNPGATGTCTATYVVTQADENAGPIVNTATVTGTSPIGVDVTATSRATTPVVPAPGSIDLVKSVSGNLTLGSTLTYRFLVTNTGPVRLTAVAVTDPKVAGVTCPDTALAPNASTTCTASYTVTQADVDAGQRTNTATARGTTPGGTTVTDTDTAVLRGTPNAAIEITKTHRSGTFAVGDQVTYEFSITNKGNVTLNPVTFSDAKLGITAATCGQASLAPGLSTSCTRTYTITQADANAGAVVNTATTTGVPPAATGLANVTDDDNDRVPVEQTPQLSFDKSYTGNADGDGNGRVSAGDVLTYTLVATNTGNVTLTAARIADAKLGTLTCTPTQPATLAPGATLTCTGTYTATTADANAGRIDNTATATATPPSGPGLTSTDSATVILPQSPGISLTKSFARKLDRDSSGGDSAGDGIVYTFTIRNTGNVVLNPITLSDPTLGLSGVTCGATSLAAGATTTCEQTYTVTQADINVGTKANTATVTGQPPAGISPVTDTSNETVPLVRTPAITLDKATTTTTTRSGQTVPYTFLVTNTGNVPLNPVVVTDPKVGTVTCAAGALAPKGTRTCTASYTVTTADADAGTLVNTATVTGTPPAGLPDVTARDSVTVPVTGTPAITLTKTDDAPAAATAGSVVTYTFGARNTGDVTLNTVAITDPLPGLGALTCAPAAPATLAPNATQRCTAPYTLTQADVDAGGVNNTATVLGTPANGASQVRATANDTVPLTRRATFTLDKSASVARASIGDVVTYTFVVTNTGTTTLSAVTVTDPLAGLSALTCDTTTLLPGAKQTCTATRTVTTADAAAGRVDNTATATVTPPAGVTNPGPQRDSASVLVTQPVPTANPDVSSGPQGQAQSVTPLTNDVPGNAAFPLVPSTLTYLNQAGNPVSTVVVLNEGTYTIDRSTPAAPKFVFTPLPNFIGQATPVDYRIADSNGNPAQSTYTPTVTGVTPVARPDTTSGPQNVAQSINPLTNDSPGDATVPLVPSTVTYLDGAGNPVESITVPDEGRYTINRSNPAVPLFVFTPVPSFVGTATPAPYRISDTNGTPASSTYTPTLVGVTPVANPDVTSGPQGRPQSIEPLTNDVPGATNVPLVPSTLTYLNAAGNPVSTLTVPNQGTYTIDRSTPAEPKFVFTPLPAFVGTATPAPYRISDSNGTTARSTYTPTLVGVTPTARPDTTSGPQNRAQSINPLTNDSAGDPAVPLVPSSVTYLDGSGNPVESITVPNQGRYTINRSNPDVPLFVFTPVPSFVGTATPAPYRISDTNGTSARSTYTPTLVGVIPDANPDTTRGPQGRPQSIDPLANDVPGAANVPLVPSTLTYLNAAGDPVATLTVPGQGVYSIDRSDPDAPRFVFTPEPDFVGTATPADYRISDANGTPAQSTYTPTLIGVTPVAQPDFSSGQQNRPQSAAPLTNDSPGAADVPLVPSNLTYLDPTTGAPVATVTVPGEGTYSINRSNPTAPRFVFTPIASFVGDATPVPYRISDANGTPAESTYTPTVVGVTPTAEPDSTVGPQGRPQSVNPLTNDSPGSGEVPLIPTTLTYLDGAGNPVETLTVPGEGVYTINRANPAVPLFVFTPEPQFVGTATPQPYRISDDNGTPARSTYTPRTIGITPLAEPDSTSGPQGRPQSVNPLTNDTSGDPTVPLNPLTLTYLDGTGQPVATVTVPGQGTYSIDRTNPAAPRFVFTPEPQFTGTATPAPYRISDANGTPAESTYTPSVVPVTPTAAPDTTSGPQGVAQRINPLTNDAPGAPDVPLVASTLTYLDATGTPVTTIVVPNQGTYTVDRTNPAVPLFVFTPLPAFVGTATPAPYRISDANGTPATSTYTPALAGVTPKANPDVSRGPQGKRQSVAPLANDTPGSSRVPLVPRTLTYLDRSGNPVDTVTVPGQGVFTIDRSTPTAPAFVFTPETGFVGSATPVPYRISDRNGTPTTSTYTPTTTPSAPPAPAIEVTKKVSAISRHDDGSHTVTYTLQIGNAGTTPVSAVQLTDDLGKTFARAKSIEVVGLASDILTVNPAYDGVADTKLLTGTDTLAAKTGGSVDVAVVVDPGTFGGTFLNSASGTARTVTGRAISDVSDSGTLGCKEGACPKLGDPKDPHAGEPGDKGTAEDPTPVTFGQPSPSPSPTPSSTPSPGPLASTGVGSGTMVAGGLAALLLVLGGASLYVGRRGRRV